MGRRNTKRRTKNRKSPPEGDGKAGAPSGGDFRSNRHKHIED